MRRICAPAGAVALVGLMAALPLPGGAQSWRTVTMSRQVASEDAVDVRVRFGAGRLTVRPADQGVLYRMQLRYDEETFQPVADFDGSRLKLGVESVKGSVRWKGKENQEMALSLARGLPMALDLEFGAVRADMDLGDLRLTSLSLSTGASESDVDFSAPNPERMSTATFRVGAADFEVTNLGNLNAERISVDAGVGSVVLDFQGEWQGDADVTVDMGLGSLELRFPEGLGVRLVKDTFLTSLDAQGLVKRGNSYYSVDWEEARHRVTVSVDAAFGSIGVVWVR